MKTNVLIGCLAKDGLQLRESLSEDVVAAYAEAMRGGAEFPPVTVFTDGRTNWLADGFHRVEAATRAGFAVIAADVIPGDYWAAEAYACGANAVTPRSVETKRRCVLRLWENRAHHFGKGDPSEREIANLAHLPRSTVHTILAELANAGQLALPRTVTGGDGVTRPRRMPVRPVRPKTTDEDEPRPIFQKPAESGAFPTDRYGVEIPVELQTAFRTDGLEILRREVSMARARLRRAFEEKDPRFAAVRQDALVNLDNAHSFLRAAFPHCVCRMCQGNGCKACHSRGWQTEEEYDRNPAEFKA